MRPTKPKPKRPEPRRRKTGRAAAARPESIKADSIKAESAKTSSEAASEATHKIDETARTAFNAWTESGTIVARGMEDIGQAWLRFTQRSMEDGAAAARALLAAQSLREAVEVQSDYARNSLGSLVAESVRFSELSVGVARAAMEPLKAGFEAAAARTS